MKNWEKKKLGEVCIVERGSSPRPIEKYQTDSPDGVNWIKIGDTKGVDKYIFSTREKITKEGAEKSRYVKEGDFILSNSMSFGKPYIMRTDGYIHDGWFVFRLPDYLDKDYFYHLLTSPNVQEQIQSLGAGAIVKNISGDLVKKVDITFPKSLHEQQRIVAILDEAFAAIAKAKANAEQNLKNAKELFESYLQGVFEKKGEGWEEKFLEDLADESCTLSYGIVQPGEEFEDGLPVVRPTDLTSRFIKVEGLKRIDPKLAEGYKRTKLVGDELLLCVRGTTGVVSIATTELKNANVTRGIVPIRFNSKFINQEFGYYLLISNYVQKQIRAKTYGAALMQINIGDLRKIITPYPSIKEQESIVLQLDALRAETQRLAAVYQQKLEDLEELKKSILQKAFAGELKLSESGLAGLKDEQDLSNIKKSSKSSNQKNPTDSKYLINP